MKTKLKTIALLISIFLSWHVEASIPETQIRSVIQLLSDQHPEARERIEKGVRQIARLWQQQDGDETEFLTFCEKNFIATSGERERVFQKISHYFEALWGHFNEITLQLQLNLHLDNGPLSDIDPLFGAYSPGAHLINDFYNNKIGFIIALNFPKLSLAEKETLGTNRLEWAYARLGDIFTERIPSDLLQAKVKAESDADVYISAYNIHMGHILNNKNEKLFPAEMILLSHWNLRDEIKANYNKGKTGLNKQETVYKIMQRIITQEIPAEVIHSGQYDWNPYTNTVSNGEKSWKAPAENNERYRQMLRNFHAVSAIDKFTGNTFIDRKFNDEMEVSLSEAEALFNHFLSSPQLKEAGKLISKRLGRKLKPFDIWYDGFKARSNLDENKLNNITRQLYPDAEAMKAGLPALLIRLGFTPERAGSICDKIAVDAARGSGHAWGAVRKGQQSHLRTRIPAAGMDYKGYNIAIHEFGHNVEQTISMYDVDHYMMSGVPNTAFTEALAFIFQKRDLQLLGIDNTDPDKQDMEILDKFWSAYEIMGVSMLDIAVWKWMYAHPTATPEELKIAVIALSKDVWNKYFAPVFGTKDELILGIYSHMICYPLYLSAYAFGQIIDFQVDNYLQSRHFASEVDRMYRLGRLTPNQWMIQATGSPLSVDPILKAADQTLQKMKKNER